MGGGRESDQPHRSLRAFDGWVPNDRNCAGAGNSQRCLSRNVERISLPKEDRRNPSATDASGHRAKKNNHHWRANRAKRDAKYLEKEFGRPINIEPINWSR